MKLIRKVFIISVCIILLVSCGRKNEPKYEALIDDSRGYFYQSNFYSIKNDAI